MCTGVSPFRIATGVSAKLKQVRVEHWTGQENLFSWIRPARRICGEAASEGPKVLSLHLLLQALTCFASLIGYLPR